ncbi:hypothetical protein AC1031_017281 [Aphanomyces cochlioides]|nr:hypothetical protein AC1031_017281 [Aphanomyces cochlioides]
MKMRHDCSLQEQRLLCTRVMYVVPIVSNSVDDSPEDTTTDDSPRDVFLEGIHGGVALLLPPNHMACRGRHQDQRRGCQENFQALASADGYFNPHIRWTSY